jgi:Tfp pilus assembly protein PilV
MEAKGFLNNEKGMSLIEVLIAGVIFAFVLLSFGYMFALGQGLTGSGGDRRFALAYSQESMEELEARGFTTIESDLTNNTLGYGWTYDAGTM